jgi:hypothetical protein
LRGEWSPEVGRGDSKHPSLPLARAERKPFDRKRKPAPRTGARTSSKKKPALRRRRTRAERKPLSFRHCHQRPILEQNTQQHRIHRREHQRIRDAGDEHCPCIAVKDVERQRVDDHRADEVCRQHTAPQPGAGAQMGKLPPAQAADQADGRRTQRDERIDGIASQHAADDVGHHAHDETRPRSKEDARQQHRQTAQIEPDKAGGDAQHPGKDDAHGDEQSHRRQGAHGDPGFFFHINCPPVFQELRGSRKKRPPL